MIIDPVGKLTIRESFKTFEAAKAAAGLVAVGVDHASLGEGLSIAVYEYGLFKHPDDAHYFTLQRLDGTMTALYEGPAVLMCHDQLGMAVDFPKTTFDFVTEIVVWLTFNEAEGAIKAGRLPRPRVIQRNEWRWPDPPPSWVSFKRP